MTDVRWSLMWDLFHRARDIPAAEREAFLHDSGADAALRAEVIQLLDEAEHPLSVFDVDTARAPGPAWRPGDRVGPYLLQRLLGDGGMGVVFDAEQTEPVRRRVALKLIRVGAASSEIAARFRLERRALARLDHPNIARIYDAGATDGDIPYMAMELVDGPTLLRHCDDATVPVRRRLELFIEVCSGIEHAHQRGLIHRDLKPSNVLVSTASGAATPKIIDFGIARAIEDDAVDRTFETQAGRLVGTPQYMSPEQASFEHEVDTRTDVYALGVLLYELLVGVRPFEYGPERADLVEILERIRRVDATPPSRRCSTRDEATTTIARARATDPRSLRGLLRGDLDWIVMRTMEKEPERRYPSAAALAADLRRHLDDRPVLAGPPSTTYRLRKFVRRHRVPMATAAIASLLIVSAAALGISGQIRADAERDERRAAAVGTSRFLTTIFKPISPEDRSLDSITARELLTRGLEAIPGTLGEFPEPRAILLHNIGKIHLDSGLYVEAEQILQQALALNLDLYGERSEPTQQTRVALGAALALLGRHQEAVDEYMRAIEFRELPPKHRANAAINLGRSLTELGRHEQALPWVRQTAQDVAERHGPASPRHGVALRTLAICLTRLEQFAEAEQVARQSLEILESKLGPDHGQVQYTLNSLSILHWELGEYERSRPLLERALASVERSHGPDHPHTASLMNNYGLLLLELQDLEGARSYLEAGLRVREERLPAEHPHIAVSVLNLARLYAESDERERAIDAFERGLALRSAAEGNDATSLVSPLNRYADYLEAWGEPQQAERLRQRATEIESSTS